MRKNRKHTKLSPKMLRKMVLEEKARIVRETSDPIDAGVDEPEDVDADEKDADEQADTLAKDIDHLKVLKIEEKRLYKKLVRVHEAKKKLRSRLLSSI